MKIVIFGLSISSSWGNGHATLWRGLCAALIRRGHRVVFFERDVPYYAATRDFTVLPGGHLVFYSDWASVRSLAGKHLDDCDVALTTSYCPDAIPAGELLLASRAQVRCFYDLDTPITLDRLERGISVDYIGARGLQDFDLTLSYSGGESLKKLQEKVGARSVAPLYGSVDPAVHFPVPAEEQYRADVSYLGTWAADRQERLDELFVQAAKELPERKFLIGGSLYDNTFPWQPNIHLKNHVPVADHPNFYCSARLTLNVTRKPMADNGYCPSGRLFEAAACGCVILSDRWEGLDLFFTPDSEILLAEDRSGTKEALQRSSDELRRIGRAAREKVLELHTADVRARELEGYLEREAA